MKNDTFSPEFQPSKSGDYFKKYNFFARKEVKLKRCKVAKLRLPKGISVRTVLVYDGNLAPEVEENGYFDYLVPVSQLFFSKE